MTVQTELNSSAQSLEYIACIEGIGWPSDPGDLTDAFQGTVIVSADINSSLATVLGCSVNGGFSPPSAFSDSIDPVTLEYRSGGVDFDVANIGEWLDDEITPRKNTESSGGAQLSGQLMVDLTYQSDTVDIDQANPGGTVTPFVEGDVAWIGGREAVLLGRRAAEGAGYRYTTCTRGYLGTPRGPWDQRASWQGAHLWKADTTVYPWNPFWRGRRVMIFAHVPGELRGNCVRIFQGRLTNISREEHGTVWRFGATADSFLGRRREVQMPEFVKINGYPEDVDVFPVGHRRLMTLSDGGGQTSGDQIEDFGVYYLYRYREVPGGAELPSVDETTPQAETNTITEPEHGDEAGATTVYMAQTLVLSGGVYWRLLYKYDRSGVADVNELVSTFMASLEPGFSQDGISHEWNIPYSVLLDNIMDEAGPNRFTVNGTIRRNPVDVALIWMTSCDSEFYRGDAAAAGTTTTVNFTAPGWTTGQWTGYALFCVEGTNKGEARWITNNDADTTTVDTAFTADTHEGNEYQIRNTIYDVLPWGWGLGILNRDIDTTAWEDLRDHYLPDAELGRFAIGEDPNTDYWDLLTEAIFIPYGIAPYVSRSTGKLSARFMFSLTTDAAFETVTAITDADLLPGSFSSVDMTPRQPVTRIRIITRKTEWNLVKLTRRSSFSPLQSASLRYGNDSEGHVVEIRAGDAEFTYDESERETLTIPAPLNDRAHLAPLAAMHQSRLRDLVKACYETTIYLQTRLMLLCQAGSLLSITSTAFGARDPFTASEGLSGTTARVLSSKISVEPGGQAMVEARIQLLDPVESCRIAPACDCVAYPDNDTIEVDIDKYVDEPSGYDVSDVMLFAVDDRIEIRTKTGAFKEGPFTVSSFGANASATPAGANSAVVNINGPIAGAFAAGDYITFYKWDANATTNMELYSALADATDEELGAGDSPKEYL